MGGPSGARQQREQAIAECCSDIEKADFVALDLEFSGLFLDADDSRSRSNSSLQEYYTRCIRSIPEFLPLQLGLCCAQLVDDVWELRVHEFNLWPNKRLFVSDFKSLQFLREHGSLVSLNTLSVDLKRNTQKIGKTNRISLYHFLFSPLFGSGARLRF